ncbi:MAG: hypothetical protein CSA81_01895 [Acidobacteria bacterium]|nr:MAG: hypothetical protein CSA81_01895 [Acidobacteriota bacterium]
MNKWKLFSCFIFAFYSYEFVFARFLQPDPKREHVNSYSYVGNNPILMVDPNGEDSYVFYDPKKNGFLREATFEAKRLSSVYKTPVHMVPIKSKLRFWLEWNKMSNVDCVSLLFHGSEKTININYKTNDYLTTLPSGKTPLGYPAVFVGLLNKQKIKEIRLMTCQGGNIDVSNNMARTLSDLFQTTVTAWDGGLSYINHQTPRKAGLSNIAFAIDKGREPLGMVEYKPGQVVNLIEFNKDALNKKIHQKEAPLYTPGKL